MTVMTVTIQSISEVAERITVKSNLSGHVILIPCVKMVSLLKNSMKEQHSKEVILYAKEKR